MLNLIEIELRGLECWCPGWRISDAATLEREVAGDEKEFKNEVYEEDLFTLSERDEAIAGEELDWNEAEDDADEESLDEEEEFIEY